MKTHNLPTYLFILLLVLSNCKKNTPLPVQVAPPKIYNFTREGHANVSINGQVCRNLLIQDLEILLINLSENQDAAVTYERLYSYFDNNKETIEGPTLTITNPPALYTTIREISTTRDMKSKFHGSYIDQAQQDIEYWCSTIVSNIEDPEKKGTFNIYIDEDTGYDMLQMYKLTLLGGAMWSHGINNYFRFVENDNNDTIVSYPSNQWLFYTWMEHHLDETFGYYGAARKFHNFTDEEVAGYQDGLNYKDNLEEDGKIDFKMEYNFAFARLAAARDLDSKTGLDFSRTIYDAFF